MGRVGLVMLVWGCSGGDDPAPIPVPERDCTIPAEVQILDEPALPWERESFAMTTDGEQVWVMGGWNTVQGGTEADVFVAPVDGDDRLGSFADGPALPAPRQHAGAAVVAGEVAFIGGDDGSVNASELFWGDGQGWAVGTGLPAPVSWSAVASDGSTLWVAGGLDGTTPTSQVLRLDEGATEWVEEPDLPQGLFGASAVWDGERLLVVGGGTGLSTSLATIYALEDGAWSEVGALPDPRMSLGLAVVRDLLVVSGGLSDGVPRDDLIAAHLDDLDAGGWGELGTLLEPRFAHGMVALGDRVMLTGGWEELSVKGLVTSLSAQVCE